MPELEFLDIPTTRITGWPMSPRRQRKRQQTEPVRADDSKGLYQEIVVLSSADGVQTNLNRIVLYEIEESEEPSSYWRGVKVELPRPTTKRSVLFDHDQAVEFFAQIATFIAAGGAESVVKVVRELRKKPVSDEAFRAFAEALQNAMQSGASEESEAQARSASAGESFIERARRLDTKGQTDAALDLIYDRIDEMLRDGSFSEVDSLLASLPVNDLSVDILLGVLTASLPARSRLPSREAFLADVEKSIRERDEYEDGLLTGL